MSRTDQILKMADQNGIIRPRDVEAIGIPRAYLSILCKSGKLERRARGLYARTGAPTNENYQLEEIAKRIPSAVFCLLSALSFHNIGTQIPHEIWITVPKNFCTPKIEYPPMNLTYSTEPAYSFGIQEHIENGVPLKVYSPAKTVVDCFKFRNKVGLDVALEALKETWRARKATADELVTAAKVCRMYNVMRPYMEAIV
jgi:predicted transcriptional regulator of viral defense system